MKSEKSRLTNLLGFFQIHIMGRETSEYFASNVSAIKNDTLTANDRNPSEWTAVWWTKTSSVPSSGTMNPKPFLTSNHFTVPDVMLSEKHRMLNGVLMANLLAAAKRLPETRAADLRMDPNMVLIFLFCNGGKITLVRQ